jgi:preprotein translocase subunit SecG
LGGFESILSRMTAVNFNWFIHTMLFLHTQKIIQKKTQMESAKNTDEEDEDTDSDQEIGELT